MDKFTYELHQQMMRNKINRQTLSLGNRLRSAVAKRLKAKGIR